MTLWAQCIGCWLLQLYMCSELYFVLLLWSCNALPLLMWTISHCLLYIILLTGNLYQQQTVEEFAEQVFSALNKMYSNVKHLSEVHVVIFDHRMAQQFIMAMQQCFKSQDSKPKGWLMEKLANYMPKAG